jgi:hypothetical protein
MKRVAILSLFLCCIFLTGQQYNIPFAPTSGASNFCALDAQGSIADVCEDFEEGQDNCTLTETEGNFAGFSPTHPAGGGDCDNTTTPPSGSYQLLLADDGPTDSIKWAPTSPTEICSSAEDCELRFIAELSGSHATPWNFAAMHKSDDSLLCAARWIGSTGTISANCDAGSSTTGSAAAGTYKICLIYDVDGNADCDIKVDPVAGTWCAGTTLDKGRANCNGTDDDVDYMLFGDGNDNLGLGLDDIHVVGGRFP